MHTIYVENCSRQDLSCELRMAMGRLRLSAFTFFVEYCTETSILISRDKLDQNETANSHISRD